MHRQLEGILVAPIAISAIPLAWGIYTVSHLNPDENGMNYAAGSLLISTVTFATTIALRGPYRRFREKYFDK